MHQFQVIEQIGSGSFGNVLKVKKKKDGIIYAMKQIKIKQLSAKEKSNALNQIRLLASIQSQNIIQYKSAFFDYSQNKLCMVMEFAEGGDLATFIKNKKQNKEKIKEQFIWKTAYDILRGLKTLHENNIIHRDIKPGNIFLVNGIAKLGDMNFATTATGTPFYISPEIWKGSKYDQKCDIWSFGCLLYELCMLKPPYMANDYSSLIKKIRSGYYQPLNYAYSKKLSNLIKRCLTTEPTKRPSADQLLKINIFQSISNHTPNIFQSSNVSLLDTITFSNSLSNLNDQLPQKGHRKMITMKDIYKLDNQDDYEQFAKKRVYLQKTKKFISQRFINGQEIYEIINNKIQHKKQNKISNQNKLNIIQKLKTPLPVKKLRIRMIPKCQSKKI